MCRWGCIEVGPKMNKICGQKHNPVLLAFQSLMNSLHCSSDHNKLIPLLIRMVTKEAFEEDKGDEDSGFSVHIHGSLVAQELLRFQKPIKAVGIKSPEFRGGKI